MAVRIVYVEPTEYEREALRRVWDMLFSDRGGGGGKAGAEDAEESA